MKAIHASLIATLATLAVPADAHAATRTLTGKVLGAVMKNPTGFAQSSAAGVDYLHSTTGDPVQPVAKPVAYAGAQVCADRNRNGACDAGEDATVTALDGTFSLVTATGVPLAAIVDQAASYLDPNSRQRANVAEKMVFQAAAAQAASLSGIILSPLSTEAMRAKQAGNLTFAAATRAIAARLSLDNVPARSTDFTVLPAHVTADLSTTVVPGRPRKALLMEAVALSSRLVLASRFLDRGYVGDPDDPVTTLLAAQEAAQNLEGIPRYDHLFVMIFENHNNQVIDAPYNVNFFRYLNFEGNKAANYFSDGNPSEPNYVSLGSGDDWGITDDSGWNCVPANEPFNLPSDVYNPRGACTNDTNHNIKGRRNVFAAMYQAGLPTRAYHESMDPGQDPRNNGEGNPAIMGVNKRFKVAEAMGGSLYVTKHHPAINFDDVRNRPDFFANLSRTLGGGQWDAGIAAYAKAHGIAWNTHQFEDDLKSGDVGALNFLTPDQCDDIHGVEGNSVDCDFLVAGVLRGDAYARYVVEKIKASPLWKNPAKRVGIVLVFDEGSVFIGSPSCCGWNAGGGATSGGPFGEAGAPPVANYNEGNRGDGPTIFGVLNNQPLAPKGIVDSDVYSHLSFVRTLQDMFGLADPGLPESYMNRSKYTERYIAAHLGSLPEFLGSASPHFDAVRPMNHRYAVQAGEQASNGLVILAPDPTQTSIWSLE